MTYDDSGDIIMDIFVQISDSVLHGDFNKYQSLVSSTLKQDDSARSILDKGLFTGNDIY